MDAGTTQVIRGLKRQDGDERDRARTRRSELSIADALFISRGGDVRTKGSLHIARAARVTDDGSYAGSGCWPQVPA